jgi:Domain of unknown function (DUF3883)
VYFKSATRPKSTLARRPAQPQASLTDSAQYKVVKTDFSRYLLPVVATPNDPHLKVLRGLGMVTVVRLPVTTVRGADVARAQTRRLLEPTPPIALFLDRLRSITVEHVDRDGIQTTSVVDRVVQEVDGPPGGPILRWVETVGQRFLTASRTLNASDVRRVVSRAIELGELDPSWAAWDTDVEVSLAVSASGNAESLEWPSAYTYLPMRVDSPAFAHLHAPFHTKMARLDLNEDSFFNSFLIATAADLAADTIALLTSTHTTLDLHTRQVALADLLCWSDRHIGRLRASLNRVGVDILRSPLVPARGPAGGTWAALEDVRAWTSEGLDVLTTEAVESRNYLLDQSIGLDRVGRLKMLCERLLSRSMEPNDSEVGKWIEEIASGLPPARIDIWNRFLGDVARVFESRDATALQRRFILLDDKGKLRRSGPWSSSDAVSSDPTMFLPPLPASAVMRRAETEDAELRMVPKNLQRAITFLHEGIRVRARLGSTFQRTAVGDLLRKGDLVEQFELSAVLGHLERLLAGKVSETTYRQALAWVYAQERASRANIADLGRIGLRVPTRGGWLPARLAIFSRGWRAPRAQAVAALVEDAAGLSASIRLVGERTIRPPTEWPFKLKDVDTFRDFLSRSGVRDGLFPVSLGSRTAIRMNGNNFMPSAIASRFGLTDCQDWVQHVSKAWRAQLVGPQTPYTGSQRLWIVPGQDAFEDLGVEAKNWLASAILESMADWPVDSWNYEFRRRSPHHATRPDPQLWPSPAKSFVERARWFPMSNPNRREARYFVPLAEGWTFDESSSETAPRFARLAPVDQRRRLAASPATQERLTGAGLQTWNRPASAGPRLAELARLVASGDLPEAELVAVRRAASRAWYEFVRLPHPILPTDLSLIVTRGSAVEVVLASPSDPPEVFVHDAPPGLVAQVLEAGGFAILVADPVDGTRIADALAASKSFYVRRSTAVKAEVILDGRQLHPSPDIGTGLLEAFDAWTAGTMMAIIDLRSNRFVRITEKVLHDAEARLRRIRLVVGSLIHLTIDDVTLPASGRLAECVHLDDGDAPLLVLNSSGLEVPSWRAIEVLADDMSELMGQGQIASEIRAAALTLQRTVGDWREPSDEELAKAMRCNVGAVTEARNNQRTSSDHLRLLLAPIVGVLADYEAAERVVAQPIGNHGDLYSLVSSLIGDEKASVLFAKAARAESLEAFRRDMRINLGELNTILRQLGRQPLHFPELHHAALISYLDENRVGLLSQLRERFIGAFRAHADLAAYASARDFRDLMPDPAWLDANEVPTAEMMADLALGWLRTKGEEPTRDDRTLASVDDVREANLKLSVSMLPNIAKLIVARHNKMGLPIPEAWLDLRPIRDALSGSGCLDFVDLDDRGLLTWLVALNLWPIGMNVSLDPSDFGLSPADLEDAISSAARANDSRRRRRTELRFGGRSFDVATDELDELLEAVAASVSEAFLQTRPAPTNLSVLRPPDRRPGAGRSGQGAPRRYGSTKPTQEQTAAIGLAGEILAYRWLQRAYKETTPDSWVSANRVCQLGGSLGDDSLGYDFRVARNNETLYFEVKATTTDDYEFDLGESELRMARAARKGWYRILFINSILFPEQRQLLVLPNPLELDVISSFVQVNQGLRIRFNPSIVDGKGRARAD